MKFLSVGILAVLCIACIAFTEASPAVNSPVVKPTDANVALRKQKQFLREQKRKLQQNLAILAKQKAAIEKNKRIEAAKLKAANENLKDQSADIKAKHAAAQKALDEEFAALEAERQKEIEAAQKELLGVIKEIQELNTEEPAVEEAAAEEAAAEDPAAASS